jgi:large subunit ribosomal protein L18
MNRLEAKKKQRLGRKIHIRKRISGTAERPRMCVFKSNKHLYVQVIDDIKGHTVAAVSSLEKDLSQFTVNMAAGQELGKVIGARLNEKGIKAVVFDRNGYQYHGVVKAVAEAARGAGIQF